MRCWLNLDLPAEEIAGLRARFPDIEFLERHPAPANLANVEVAFVARQPIADETLATMTSLKWMHMQHGGADRFLTPTSREHPVRITSATGATGQPFVEFAIACIFTLAKRLPEVWRAQSELRWDESIVPASVEGSTLGIVGLGSIGSRVARKAHGLGMRVLATKRQVGPDVPADVDELGPPSFLPELLAQSDYVVVLVPSSVKGVFGEAELLGMKPGSFLINLTGRQAVDEAALVRSLKDGPLAGAVLSTFDYSQRELPLESELWRLPNAIVVPRIAGVGAPQWRLAIDLFASNLDRYLAGDPLANLVDKDLGYATSSA